jgi:hypothetical protein
VLLLNLPLLKDKLVPFLARCWKDFFKDVEELGPKAAVIKFINSLSQILDQIVDHYRERFANAKTIEEKEEILGELLGYGIVTLETGVGVAKVAVKSGKAISRLPGKIPPQMRALEAHLSQQLGSMSETLGPKKMGEVLERIQLKASQVKRAGAAAGDVNAAGAGVEGQVLKSLEAQSSGAELVSSKGSQLVEAQATKAAQENLLGVIEQRTETLRLQRNAAAREAAFETGKWVIVTRSGEKIVKNVSKRKPELFGRSVVGKKYTAITQLEDLPIHFDHAKNFRGASFWDIAPQPGETFIRWGNAEGSWWARVPPESNFQSMIDLAILYEWNKWDRISYFTVPKSGVPWTFFEGYAGSQAGQMSKVSRTGASSIYIGNKGQVYIRREIYNTDEFKKLVITESAKDYFSKPRK